MDWLATTPQQIQPAYSVHQKNIYSSSSLSTQTPAMQRMKARKSGGVSQQRIALTGSDHGSIMKTYFGEDDAPGIKV